MDTPATTYSLGPVHIGVYGRPGLFAQPKIIWDDPTTFASVDTLLSPEQKTIAIPQVDTFNAKVGTYADFATSQMINGVFVHTGAVLDAVVLQKSESAGILTRDCPTIVFYNNKTGEGAAAHAGRASLIDRQRVDTGAPSRTYEGIVQAVFAYTQWNPADLSIFVTTTIAAQHFSHPFDHPTYGMTNKRLVEWLTTAYGQACIEGKKEDGCIDLYQLVRAQCVQEGVLTESISHDGVDTYSDERFWSTRNPEKKGGRNIIIVTNPLT